MEANTRKLERIFDQTITYQVPLFQRPCVWTQEANWEPVSTTGVRLRKGLMQNISGLMFASFAGLYR